MINILPYNQKKVVERLRLLHVVIATLWAVILLFGIGMLLLMPLLVTINSHFGIATAQIEKLEQSGKIVSSVDVTALQGATQELLAKLAAEGSPAPTVYIKGIQSHVPLGVTLSGFTLREGGVSALEVQGKAGTREALQRFIAALEADQAVASVQSPVSNFVKSANVSFTIIVTFK